jgi:Cu/Ag efflux protein CusF
MRPWKVVVLLNLALLIGIGLGSLHGVREARRLQEELERLRALVEQPGRSTWSARGIVRAVVPSARIVVLTHEALPGLMQGMTMPFQADDPKLLDGLQPGDPVRFSVHWDGNRIVLVAIEKVVPR